MPRWPRPPSAGCLAGPCGSRPPTPPPSRRPWSASAPSPGTWPEPSGFSARSSRATTSEEHTSELQSLRHLVCRLLLEKKKKQHVRLRTTRARVLPLPVDHEHTVL